MDGGNDWTSTILIILILSSFLLNFTDIPQKMQLWRWASYIRKRLCQLDEIESESRRKAVNFLGKLKVSNPGEVLNKFIDNYFTISPVDIEPTDIIKRLKHLIRTREVAVRNFVRENIKDVEDSLRDNAEAILEIVSAITNVNKVVKHYFQLGLKFSNWVLVMQLALEMPRILRIAKSYTDAIDAFAKGTPIGDGAGPLVVKAFVGRSSPREIVEKTELYEVTYKERRLYVVKARGPGAAVGWPGEAVEKVVESLNGNVSRIVTVDAALKLESEESGEVAHGTGAAIGDPGPEKISIERVATKYSIPLEAVIVKMSDIEAINTMTKKVYEGVKRAIKIVENIITEHVPEGGAMLLIGIGNTVGIR